MCQEYKEGYNTQPKEQVPKYLPAGFYDVGLFI
jgi:hypothetical protein